VLVEVVAVGERAALLPEDLAAATAQDFGEVPVVGLGGDLDQAGVVHVGVPQRPDDVPALGLDEVKYEEPL